MNTVIVGIIWTCIFFAIGYFALEIDGWPGTIISIFGFLMGILSAMHVLRIIKLGTQGMKMMKENPEEFERNLKEYEETMEHLRKEEGD